MASIFQKVWAAAPPIVRATLDAAWTASKIGAISLAAFFTIANLAMVLHEFAVAQVRILDLLSLLLGIIVSGVVILLLALLFSVVITIPVSIAVAACAYPFLRYIRAADRSVYGVVGFCVGALVWLGLWWNGPPGNLYFGSWFSVAIVGGPAGCAGGLAFARHFPKK